MNIYISHSSSYNYETELYTPLKSSELAHEHQIFFPHDPKNIDTKSKNVIQQSDLVLAEISHPSTGQGIELGWAESANTPILCIYRAGTQPSSSLRFVSEDFLEYSDQSDMMQKIENWLVKINKSL